jgi:hypothetical protein
MDCKRLWACEVVKIRKGGRVMTADEIIEMVIKNFSKTVGFVGESKQKLNEMRGGEQNV